MRTAKSIQEDIYNRFEQEQYDRDSTRTKKSFWPTDAKKTRNELYWAWTNEPKTNLISAEKLSMFKIAKLCELHYVQEFVKIGFAADLDNPDHVAKVEAATGRKLAFAKEKDEFGQRQLRVEMEREFVPVTGYMDGITLNGEPIEIKSTRSVKYIKDIATGKPPQVEHVYQLATYMDFIGSDVGWLAVCERAGGAVFFVKVEHRGNLVYATTDYSLGLPEEMETSVEQEQPYMQELIIDLGAEYMRWRKLFEDHIHPLKEPALEFEYRPRLTTQLLDSYITSSGNDSKVKLAIKGKRILSEHGWKPMYSDWRNLWIEKEMANKGVTDPSTYLVYQDHEIEFMLNHLDAELIDGRIRKITDTRRKQMKQEEVDRQRKTDPSAITDQRRKAGIEDITPIMSIVPAKAAEFIRVGIGALLAKDLDAVTDTELLAIQGIGAGAVKKIREMTQTGDIV